MDYVASLREEFLAFVNANKPLAALQDTVPTPEVLISKLDKWVQARVWLAQFALADIKRLHAIAPLLDGSGVKDWVMSPKPTPPASSIISYNYYIQLKDVVTFTASSAKHTLNDLNEREQQALSEHNETMAQFFDYTQMMGAVKLAEKYCNARLALIA